MPRVTLDEFAEKEIVRIYLAGELAEAERVEDILSANNINYAVEVEPYVPLGFFGSEHAGAAFYVLSGQAEYCKRVLFEAGFKVGIVEDESV